MLEAAAGRDAVLARLQLAALYAATGSAIPEARARQTGVEVALELVRQCSINRPMDGAESAQLCSIASFGRLTPALPLLCHELDMSSRELSFLHPHIKRLSPVLPLDTDAATEYTQRKQQSDLNSRQTLSADEETRVLSRTVKVRSLSHSRLLRQLQVPAAACLRSAKVIRSIETDLKALLRGNEDEFEDAEDLQADAPTMTDVDLVMKGASTTRALAAKSLCTSNSNISKAIVEIRTQQREAVPTQAFPLDASDFESTQLGKYMLDELGKSWTAHQKMPPTHLVSATDALHGKLARLYEKVQSHREELENHITHSVSTVPATAGPFVPGFNMRRAANLEPCLTLRDLARAALAPDELRRFNPFISAAAESQLHESILDWLQFCVLEDHLERMCALAARNDVQELERELNEIGREWSVWDHPAWLIFEVEQQLKIRRLQYLTAKHLIENPGSVTQLNMGEGKTRVILPMLQLHLARPGTLIRLHFLSQLLGEAFHFLHRHLTASLMNKRLCLLPFHRDVKLTANGVRTMYEVLMRCMNAGGAVCVAPEHRLSLQLKWHELRLSGSEASDPIRAELTRVETSLPFYDLLDESDEVLRHKYQLIYAWGGCKPLPAGSERWSVAEALLRELQTNSKLASLLAVQDVSKRHARHEQRGAGALDDIRLLPGEAFDAQRSALLRELATAVVDNPPHEMRWLKLRGQAHRMRAEIITFVTDAEKSITWLRNVWQQMVGGPLKTQQSYHLLAVRGLLACGLLEHCLTRRFRVDYGIDPRRGISRRVAVPFRASDTPSERAEYAQPDTLILLTLLSYYHQGLTRDEIKEAARALLRLGPQAKGAEYKLWFESARPTMTAEAVEALDLVDKLDLTSEPQLDLLSSVFRFNMAAINFWLNSCVLPRETMQFPHRLVSNAFNLTDNDREQVIGFSGTKDNHLLLPLAVKQRMPDHLAMTATDGKMLSLIARVPNEDVTCLTGEDGQLLADSVLELAVRTHLSDALIDAGAAMAGRTNSQVAARVVELLVKDTHQGVVYFEPKDDTWYVLSRQGGSAPLGSSPIHEKDAFVYFDESRCRGADMKLLPKASATLTLGPGMCKDKIMQAAGRLRKLDRGQSVKLVIPAELVSKIRAINKLRAANKSSRLTALHVLKWVMHNTVQATADGLPEWASQGSHFCTTQNPNARLIDENLELEGLYGGSIAECTVYEHVKLAQAKDIERVSNRGCEPSARARELMSALSEERAKLYGADLPIKSTGLDEECERELENERELEREAEHQYPRCVPQVPKPWPVDSLLTARSPSALPESACVIPLSEAMRRCFASELACIRWDESGIFVTENYVQTVLSQQGAKVDDLGDYMRPVEWIVVFAAPSVWRKDCLLLSEWEAEQALDIMWRHARGGSVAFLNFLGSTTSRRNFQEDLEVPRLVNLFSLREAADGGWASPPRLAIPAVRPGTELLGHKAVAGLQLLAGETMFGPRDSSVARDRLAALDALLPTPEAKKAALKLPVLCGLQNNVARSDLELFCNVDIGEA